MKIASKLFTLAFFILLYNAIAQQAIAQSSKQSTTDKTTKPLLISGVYPHLAVLMRVVQVPAVLTGRPL